VAIGTESSHASLAVARIASAFLAFLVFSYVATQALAWHDASSKSRDVTRRLERDTPDDQATALAVYGDYSVSTATTPPIPSLLYRVHHDRIDRAWHAAK
jgi:hypothetical protein